MAEAWEREARACHKAGLPIPQPTVIGQQAMTLAVFFTEQRDVIWRGKLPRNVEANQRACERFLGGDTLIHQITEKRLMEMVSKMIRAGNAPGTINTRLSHLKVLLRHAKRLDMVEGELEFPWQAKGDNSRMRFLTVEEETQMLDLMTHWGLDELRRLTEVLIDTGCRPSEVISGETKGAPIKWSEVSVSAGGTAPDVNDPETGKAKAVISIMRTKTGKYRVLPLTDRARNSFLASKQVGDRRPFGNMRSDDASKMFRKVADHLGLEDVVLYTCRHTCASRLVQRGADLRRVMQWMGHTSIATTLKYAKLTPTDIFSLEKML
jgi:site-specific recombinase XerD